VENMIFYSSKPLRSFFAWADFQDHQEGVVEVVAHWKGWVLGVDLGLQCIC
jgi:hypothetical protein